MEVRLRRGGPPSRREDRRVGSGCATGHALSQPTSAVLRRARTKSSTYPWARPLPAPHRGRRRCYGRGEDRRPWHHRRLDLPRLGLLQVLSAEPRLSHSGKTSRAGKAHPTPRRAQPSGRAVSPSAVLDSTGGVWLAPPEGLDGSAGLDVCVAPGLAAWDPPLLGDRGACRAGRRCGCRWGLEWARDLP